MRIDPPWIKVMTPSGGTLVDDFNRLANLELKFLIGGHGGILKDNGSDLLTKTINRVYK